MIRRREFITGFNRYDSRRSAKLHAVSRASVGAGAESSHRGRSWLRKSLVILLLYWRWQSVTRLVAPTNAHDIVHGRSKTAFGQSC